MSLHILHICATKKGKLSYLDTRLQQPDALSFGGSNMFITSINSKVDKVGASTEELLHEAHLLARCNFEDGTKWGYEASKNDSDTFNRVA